MCLLFIWHLNLSGYLGGFSPSPATLKTRGSSVITLITFNAYDKWLFILTEHQLCKVLIRLPVLDTAPGHSELSTNAETQATSVGIHSKYRQNPWKTKCFQQGAFQRLTPTLRWVSLQFTSSIINDIVDSSGSSSKCPPVFYMQKRLLKFLHRLYLTLEASNSIPL